MVALRDSLQHKAIPAAEVGKIQPVLPDTLLVYVSGAGSRTVLSQPGIEPFEVMSVGPNGKGRACLLDLQVFQELVQQRVDVHGLSGSHTLLRFAKVPLCEPYLQYCLTPHLVKSHSSHRIHHPTNIHQQKTRPIRHEPFPPSTYKST